jgi:hypothetical protein
MTVRFRSVPPEVWCLSEALGDRRDRLLRGPEPDGLLTLVITESEQAARDGRVQLQWQDSTERPGYYRTVAQIPLSEETFDQFVNGRSGYRAQFYLSPEEGVLYNREAVDRLMPVIETAYRQKPPEADLELVIESLRWPHAKLWVFGEKQAFNEASPDSLNPPRWVENGAVMGRRAPLPPHLMLDLKGAFIHPDTGALFVDDMKLERPLDLHNRGFS